MCTCARKCLLVVIDEYVSIVNKQITGKHAVCARFARSIHAQQTDALNSVYMCTHAHACTRTSPAPTVNDNRSTATLLPYVRRTLRTSSATGRFNVVSSSHLPMMCGCMRAQHTRRKRLYANCRCALNTRTVNTITACASKMSK
jgi:hypothetical protein